MPMPRELRLRHLSRYLLLALFCCATACAGDGTTDGTENGDKADAAVVDSAVQDSAVADTSVTDTAADDTAGDATTAPDTGVTDTTTADAAGEDPFWGSRQTISRSTPIDDGFSHHRSHIAELRGPFSANAECGAADWRQGLVLTMKEGVPR